MTSFDEDPAGAILAFAAIHKAGAKGARHRAAWEASNIKSPPPGSFAMPSQIWMGPAITRPVLEDALTVGRTPEAVRRTLIRAFGALERELLLEAFVKDDNPNTAYRTITPLGEELVASDSHREYLHGLRFVVQRWSGSVACIYAKRDSGIGTGFFVSPTQVITARHVLEEIGEFAISDTSDNELEMDGPPRFPKNADIDLALITLKAPHTNVTPMRIATDYGTLDEVAVFGYPPVPHTKKAHLLVNRGEVSAVVELYSDIQAILVTCLLRGGYSGGPVLNRRGQVIGVVSKNLFKKVSTNEESANESLGFAAAVPCEWISDLIEGRI